MSDVRHDARLNAFRPDLADAKLRGTVVSERYSKGSLAHITAGVIPVRRSPNMDSEVMTEFHFGEDVTVFETNNLVSWCQSHTDGYVGYIPTTAVLMGPTPPPSGYIATMGSYRYRAPDLRSDRIDFLPRGSPVTLSSDAIRTRDTDYYEISGGGFIPVRCVSSEPPKSADILPAAERYIGCPYLWGGRSFLGLDCSGLVQVTCQEAGFKSPRDADMQLREIGVSVALNDVSEIEAGDILFTPHHTGICDGMGNIVHADGISMTVMRQPLSEFFHLRGLLFEGLTFKRLS